MFFVVEKTKIFFNYLSCGRIDSNMIKFGKSEGENL